jgi:malonyl-CoA decarboxylase
VEASVTTRSQSLIDRTLRGFRVALRLGARNHEPLKDAVAPEPPDGDARKVRVKIDACLETRGGEVSARARAAELGETYLVLDETGRRRFLEILANEYGANPLAIDAAIAEREATLDAAARIRAEAQLRRALVTPRERLLRQFNDLRPGGVKFLVDMRAEMMRLEARSTSLAALGREVRDLLAGWFDVGFLDLRRITWDTPASLLEKLIEYEAVHAIRSWDDLKHRLEVDRRRYAFFHPRMPGEPLIFVQVALVDGIADNVQALLDEDAPLGDPEQADTAIFYSISNCQRGLSGVSFGSFLIKRVVDDLVRDLPNLKTFATLSPIPGFRAWLEEQVAQRGAEALGAAEREALNEVPGMQDGPEALLAVLARPRWWEDDALAAALEPLLLSLAARYLVRERRGARSMDRVAHFHLSNGARIERINWLADTSENGAAQSAGMMVNYRYILADIEKNHEAYSGDGKVSAAAGVRKLLAD